MRLLIISVLMAGTTIVTVGCGFSFGSADIVDDGPKGRRGGASPSGEDDDAGSSATNPPTDTSSATLPNDAGGSGTKPPVDGGAAPPTGPLKAFVSSTLVTGNIGGLTGADALCNNAAKAAGITGNFTAWISTSTVNAVDRITANGPWQLVNGTEVFKTKADLTKGTLAAAFRRDEKNQEPPLAEDRVWTGTGPDGKAKLSTCTDWGGTGGAGNVGEAEQTNAGWTSIADEACTEVNRVYCLQQ